MYQSFREQQLEYRQTHLLALDAKRDTTYGGNRILEEGYFMKTDGVDKFGVNNEDPRQYGLANPKTTGIRALRNPHVYKVTCSYGSFSQYITITVKYIVHCNHSNCKKGQV